MRTIVFSLFIVMSLFNILFAQSAWKNISSLKRGTDKFSYEYDSRGRLAKESVSSEATPDGLPPLPPSSFIYKYTANSIEATDGDIRYIYKLSNGKITSVQCYNWEGLAFESAFSYNGAGQMIACKYRLGSDGVTQIYSFIWSEGNLVQLEHTNEYGEHIASAVITYSEEKQEYGIAPHPLENKTLHPILYRKGLFGVLPQNLPSQMSVSSSDRKQIIRYTYEKTAGYITKVKLNNQTQYFISW